MFLFVLWTATQGTILYFASFPTFVSIHVAFFSQVPNGETGLGCLFISHTPDSRIWLTSLQPGPFSEQAL